MHQVRLIKECDEVYLNLDEPIPCGLIVNELISNSLKYAYSEESNECELLVGIKAKGNKVTLTVADNGIGIRDVEIENYI